MSAGGQEGFLPHSPSSPKPPPPRPPRLLPPLSSLGGCRLVEASLGAEQPSSSFPKGVYQPCSSQPPSPAPSPRAFITPRACHPSRASLLPPGTVPASGPLLPQVPTSRPGPSPTPALPPPQGLTLSPPDPSLGGPHPPSRHTFLLGPLSPLRTRPLLRASPLLGTCHHPPSPSHRPPPQTSWNPGL